MIGKALEFLIRFKNDLKGVDDDGVYGIAGGEDEDEADYVDDGEPLTWAEQKGVRRELRRFQLWHALRMKVPTAWENPSDS